jgi:hypothetical protein
MTLTPELLNFISQGHPRTLSTRDDLPTDLALRLQNTAGQVHRGAHPCKNLDSWSVSPAIEQGGPQAVSGVLSTHAKFNTAAASVAEVSLIDLP